MKRPLALFAVAAAATALVAVVVPRALAAGESCAVDYRVTNQWTNGFTTNITLSVAGTPVLPWTFEFDFVTDGQKVAQGWSGNWSQSGRHVTLNSPSWGPALGTTTVGFNGSYVGSNPAPTNFKINGTLCSTGTTPP